MLASLTKPCIIISMHLIEDMDFGLRRRTWMMVRRHCSVGIVEESIAGEIVHNIRVVDQRSRVLKTQK